MVIIIIIIIIITSNTLQFNEENGNKYIFLASLTYVKALFIDKLKKCNTGIPSEVVFISNNNIIICNIYK